MGLRLRVPALSLPYRQVAIAASLAVLALVAISFARLLITEYQLKLQKQALEEQIAQLRTENQDLRAEIDYLQTDAAIEKLARDELGWTKPGDTAVIVVRGKSSEPRTIPAKGSRPSTVEAPWQRWLRLLYSELSSDH